jgi:hypothetical protein
MISLMACEKLVKLLVAPSTRTTLKSIVSEPKKSYSVWTTEPLKRVWPEGCSG